MAWSGGAVGSGQALQVREVGEGGGLGRLGLGLVRLGHEQGWHGGKGRGEGWASLGQGGLWVWVSFLFFYFYSNFQLLFLLSF